MARYEVYLRKPLLCSIPRLVFYTTTGGEADFCLHPIPRRPYNLETRGLELELDLASS